MRFILAIVWFALSLSAFSQNIPAKIRMATTQWCPYVCEQAEQGQGIVLDYLKEILSNQAIELEVQFLPWSRAIREVEANRIDGLVTAIESEAPSLAFTTVPSMYYQMCFYTDSESDWHYQDISSLDKQVVGIVKDYGYGEPLDSFIADSDNDNKLLAISGGDTLKRLQQMLNRNRVTTMVEDKFVVKWRLQSEELREAGCLKKIPFYVAFTPEFAERTKITEFIDNLLVQPENQKLFHDKYLPLYFKKSDTH